MFYEMNEADEIAFGTLAILVAQANRLWRRRRVYRLRFYGGRYVEVSWLPWHDPAAQRQYVAPADTVASAEELGAVIERMKKQIEEAGAGTCVSGSASRGNPQSADADSSLLRKGANKEAGA